MTLCDTSWHFASPYGLCSERHNAVIDRHKYCLSVRVLRLSEKELRNTLRLKHLREKPSWDSSKNSKFLAVSTNFTCAHVIFGHSTVRAPPYLLKILCFLIYEGRRFYLAHLLKKSVREITLVHPSEWQPGVCERWFLNLVWRANSCTPFKPQFNLDVTSALMLPQFYLMFTSFY